MKLAEHVYALPLSFEMQGTSRAIYPAAIETDRGVLLLDVGTPDAKAQLAAAFEDEGLSLDDVTTVVATHQDVDHAGCLAEIAAETDALVVAHAEDTPYIEGERELLKSTGEWPFSYDPVPVDIQLQDHERFRTRAGPLVAIYTPGHTPGHMSFYLPDERLLVGADAVNNENGLVGPRERVTPDMERAWESVEMLAELDVDRTLCYHGGLTEDGSDRLAELATGHGPL